VALGERAMERGVIAMIVGIGVYLAVPLALGAVFGLFVGRRFSMGLAFLYGLAWGLLVWAAMTWIILPRADLFVAEIADRYPGWWLFEHLVFGASLMLTPAIAHAVAENMKPMVVPARRP